MKYRIYFVSNSSSSSFILNKKYLTEYQIHQIYNHIQIAAELENKDEFGCIDNESEWKIYDDGKYLNFNTDMDNFYITPFLERIGVDITKVDLKEEDEDNDFNKTFYNTIIEELKYTLDDKEKIITVLKNELELKNKEIEKLNIHVQDLIKYIHKEKKG